jgi:hypothetical protein
MKKIEVPGEINEASQLILDESLEEIKPQKVEIDIWFRDDEEEEYRERTKEEILDGIREGFRDCLTGNTRPIEELWDNILISTTGTIDDDGNLVLDEPLRETKAQYVDVVIWFVKNKASLEKHPDNIARSQQEMATAELIVSRK